MEARRARAGRKALGLLGPRGDAQSVRDERHEGRRDGPGLVLESPETFAPALDGVIACSPRPSVASPESVLTPFLGAVAKRGRKVVLMTAMGVEHDEDEPLRRCERVPGKDGRALRDPAPELVPDNFHTPGWSRSRVRACFLCLRVTRAPSFIDTRQLPPARRWRLNRTALTVASRQTGPEALTYAEAARAFSRGFRARFATSR
ncbi:MAG: hypothetical protein R2724_20755 [Bryobacterales bacterium]